MDAGVALRTTTTSEEQANEVALNDCCGIGGIDSHAERRRFGPTAISAATTVSAKIRALAIAIFYALGTAIGGTAAPSLFGYLIGTGSQWALAGGYMFAAVLMLVAALAEAKLGVDAEGRSLENIAGPLSSA